MPVQHPCDAVICPVGTTQPNPFRHGLPEEQFRRQQIAPRGTVEAQAIELRHEMLPIEAVRVCIAPQQDEVEQLPK